MAVAVMLLWPFVSSYTPVHVLLKKHCTYFHLEVIVRYAKAKIMPRIMPKTCLRVSIELAMTKKKVSHPGSNPGVIAQKQHALID